MSISDRQFARPMIISAAIAVITTVVFLIVELGPGRKKPAPDREATKAAAQTAGAKVIPTQPKLSVEPAPPGPKRIPPPVPAAVY